MIIIKLHPTHTRLFTRQRTERGHATTVHVESTDGEEIEEEPVGRLGGVSDVLGEVDVVGDGVEGWGIEFGECGVGVFAVQAFLVTIDPGKMSRGAQKGK